MGVKERRNIPDDVYADVESAVRNHCKEVVNGPQSNYIKVKRVKKEVADNLPEDITSKRVRGWLVGSVLQDALYADEWGKGTYYINPDKL